MVRRARAIVEDVRDRGDQALREWMRRLDDVRPPFTVSQQELETAWNTTSKDVRQAIRGAVRNVERVARHQLPRTSTVNVRAGVAIESRVTPLARVGCYVPGGRFPLPSTAIMTVVPARVAGVQDIVVMCPSPSRIVLAAAFAAGATSVWTLGGAQAIAAAAYGTALFKRVDKIVGPGNVFVTAAKMLVAGECAIDFRAGPSEIVVWSDRGSADWIAADLAAQAEHDPAARAILMTSRPSLASEVRNCLAGLGARKNVSLFVGNRRDIITLINQLAPEHLVCDRPDDARQTVAATTFVGRWSAQAAGDYSTGSNHVLPTGGGARSRGGLSAADFVRISTVQTLTARGLRSIGTSARVLAMTEGLVAHAHSIDIRLRGTVQ